MPCESLDLSWRHGSCGLHFSDEPVFQCGNWTDKEAELGAYRQKRFSALSHSYPKCSHILQLL